MSRIPRVTGDDLIAALGKRGFSVLRIRGSHHFLRHEDGRSTVVAAHSGETVGPGLLHKILRDCQLSFDDLKLIFYTMLAEVVHFQQVAILKTA